MATILLIILIPNLLMLAWIGYRSLKDENTNSTHDFKDGL